MAPPHAAAAKAFTAEHLKGGLISLSRFYTQAAAPAK
jgi:hypothetical protein